MNERVVGCLAIATAAIGLWMAFGHVREIRPGRIVVTLHALGAAVLLELLVLVVPQPSPLTIGMAATALATGLVLPLTAKRLPESAGMILLGHGAVALVAAALIAASAVAR